MIPTNSLLILNWLYLNYVFMDLKFFWCLIEINLITLNNDSKTKS